MVSSTLLTALNQLTFDNSFTRELPGDPDTNNTRRQVIGACYSRVRPTPVANPKLVAFSSEVARQLDLTNQTCTSDEFVAVFSGNKLLTDMDAYASCYGGHQFGHWAGQLGDGRAINLGEVINTQGQRLTLQLKGAGPTPYSRTADGLAVLRSSVREFLCSEAMHHLGVPTTRALSLITTGENVMRDMFYDGNAKPEPGAVVCRVAPSFIRFGSFQILTAQSNKALLKQLLDYTIRTDFPHLGEPSERTYIAWFEEVSRTTVDMIIHWMRVGFVHGVMNTDNMSVLGLTIDYGPYGWLDNYDPDWTPNTTDAEQRRYRFNNQAYIAQWNLYQLANAIFPLISDAKPLEAILNKFAKDYDQGWHEMMADKLGLKMFAPETDEMLISELLEVLQLSETDMTIFYRRLATLSIDDISENDEILLAPLLDAYYSPETLTDDIKVRSCQWIRNYLQRLKTDDTNEDLRREKMNQVNPKYVLRNYLAQLAIDKAEQGDNSLVNELLALLQHPYDEQPSYEHYASKRPDWARTKAGCSMLSCSS